MRALGLASGTSALLSLLFAGLAAGGTTTTEVRLATTTSVENSGLLAHLLPRFEQNRGIRVAVLPVGSGQALELAARGDVDAVLTHAPSLEEEALARGTVVEPRVVMENEFLLVGPPSDPAQVRNTNDIAKALAAIARREALFVSRGDHSGTHMTELELWRAAGVRPHGPWYLEGGHGMGPTLTMAAERQAYTLTDRATFLTYRNLKGLEILVRNHPPLKNVYRAMLARPERRPQATWRAAREFVEWLVSPVGQTAIAAFRVNGEAVFTPAATSAP